MSDYANDWVGQILSGGRYRVDAKLGEGGMGFVYKVWDRNLDTDVVVKAPRKSMLDDPEFALRFALEIRSLVKLSHPNIVKVSDVGEHQGLPFAVMQFLDGGTLDERQNFGRDGRPLPAAPSSVLGWLPGMATALDFIHGKGYIHRDVKPANILFDAHGHPYLSDFGVAKVLSDVEAGARKGPALTGIGFVVGTPEYMAPELIMGNSFDGKVDQYSLAATAYEILCGRKPFTGETATAILVRQTTQEPPPMAELPASGGQAISRVILKGLAKKPGDRFGTCVELANALVAALAKASAAQPQGIRLACPSCGVGFAATADLTNFKGRKSRCRACAAPFRIAEDGLSLERIDPHAPPTPSGSVNVLPTDRSPAPAHRANRTVKLDAMPGPEPARVERTMKLDAMPSPARVQATMKLDAIPAPSARAQGTMKLQAMPSAANEPDVTLELLDDEPEARSPLPWVIGVVAAVAVVVAAAIVMVVLVTRPSKEPAVEIVSASTPPSARITTPEPPPRIKQIPTPTPAPPKVDITPEPNPIDAVPTRTAPPPPPPPMPAEEEKPPVQPPDKPEPEVPVEVDKHEEAHRNPIRKPGQAKDQLTLEQIVSQPNDHLDQLVSPSDAVLVNTNVGRRVAPPRDLSVRSKEGHYQNFEKPGSPFRIVLKPELLDELRAKINGNVLAEGEYPAVLQMKVVKDPENPKGHLGVVEWLELLYYIDPRPIAGGVRVYKDVYCVVHLSLDGAKVGRSPNFKQWQARIQTKTTTIRNQYENANRPVNVDEWGRLAGNPAGHADFFHKWIMGHFR